MDQEHPETKRPRKRVLQIFSAITLSIATVGSTWCAYQAKLWGSQQTFKLAEFASAGRESSLAGIEAGQRRNLDVFLFLEYLRALRARDKAAVEFFSRRFRPELRSSIDAWRTADPLNNPDAPLHPFGMSEYSIEEERQAKRLHGLSSRRLQEAHAASTHSDDYILLTVIFAMVLFFVGISTQFDVPIHAALLIVGMVVMAFVLVILTSYPLSPGTWDIWG